jgi:CDP-glycerol glycerophosphotransferase (TagB/SpsB family)
MMQIAFYVEYPYYFPHFLPIAEAFEKKEHQVIFVLSSNQNTKLILKIAEKNNLIHTLDENKLYDKEIDVVLFANHFSKIENIKAKKIFMDHGVGTKHCDYERALLEYDMVLVEGNYRFKMLTNNFATYANKVKKVGFSKLDSVIHISQEEKNRYIQKYNIDETKQTILYAPTFFPSSIEKMSDTFPEDFKEYNIIVKPHYLSLHRSRYKKQQEKFNIWKKYDNCEVCDASEYSLVPFLALCDVMISDESSAIFEFTALGKPVILNRFLKLRWSYYLNPNKLLKRMDAGIDSYRKIGDNAKTYDEMLYMTHDNMINKNKYKATREMFREEICGVVDGKVSQHIVNEIEDSYAV